MVYYVPIPQKDHGTVASLDTRRWTPECYNWNKKFSGSNVYIPIEDFIYRVIKIIGNYDLLFQFAN